MNRTIDAIIRLKEALSSEFQEKREDITIEVSPKTFDGIVRAAQHIISFQANTTDKAVCLYVHNVKIIPKVTT